MDIIRIIGIGSIGGGPAGATPHGPWGFRGATKRCEVGYLMIAVMKLIRRRVAYDNDKTKT